MNILRMSSLMIPEFILLLVYKKIWFEKINHQRDMNFWQSKILRFDRMDAHTTPQSSVPESPVKRYHFLIFLIEISQEGKLFNIWNCLLKLKIHSSISWTLTLCAILGARNTVMSKIYRSPLSWRLYSSEGRQWMDRWLNEWMDI